ncbi:hypothetical protein KEM48_013883 [Puccinia striiformis f. sp. tritici PST-130]|nr:hypothetical protein KEM48_013883 [Puccinia striiformis f. sp. tritici PST-130]
MLPACSRSIGLDWSSCHARNTSLELNKIVQEACVERNSYPSPFGYFFFPRQFVMVCDPLRCSLFFNTGPRVSQNLPASRYPPEARPLEEGDIASLDVTLSHEGNHRTQRIFSPI